MKNYKELSSKLINNREVSNDVLISTINELTESLNLLPYGALEEEGNGGLQSIVLKLMIKNNKINNNK